MERPIRPGRPVEEGPVTGTTRRRPRGAPPEPAPPDDAAIAARAAAARAAYDPSRYERPSVTVDVVILTVRERRLEGLLVKRKRWPFEGMWAIPGGFVEPDESLEDAAKRELREETGVTDVYLEQLYTFGDPGRDPRTRVITVVYYALVRTDWLRIRAADDAADARWFSMYDLPPLAFDHRKILDYTLQRLRGKLEYTSIGFQLLPEEFTLSALQEVYEAIRNRPLEKRNFRKKVLQTAIVEPTGATRREGRHRPARLYHFRPGAES
jgi:8-oxo-dGTP diphosphatase